MCNIDKMDYQYYEWLCRKIRIEILRMIYNVDSGHIGSSYSIVEILVALYFGIMDINTSNYSSNNRDFFILSKGHACPALYVVLALKGFFPLDEVKNFRTINSKLQGHPDMRKTYGVDMSTGSLGQGLSVGVGMALGKKLMRYDGHVYVLVGDGEMQEGQNWEALMSARKYKLDNLTLIVDRNGLQVNGQTSQVMPIEPLDDKLVDFGWELEVLNGHDVALLIDRLGCSRKDGRKSYPKAFIVNTIKGKGVSFMEGVANWHKRTPTIEELEKALQELYGDDEEWKS